MKEYTFTCEKCRKPFESQYNLSLLVPRGIQLMCGKCTNDGIKQLSFVFGETLRKSAHGLLDQFLDDLGRKLIK